MRVGFSQTALLHLLKGYFTQK